MNNYAAFGLQISSETELPGLLPGTGEPDVTIRFGEVPEHLSEPIKNSGVAYEVKQDNFLFKVPGVARFLVSHGKKIVIDRASETDDINISLFTINTPIGALLYQRGMLPMHASGVEFDGGCAIFTGVSGVGKSTLLALFHQHGYQVVADEICAISLAENGVPYVHPGVAYTWLWRDVLDYMEKDVSLLKHRPNNPEKFKVLIDQRFYKLPLPLKRVYVLSTKNTPGIEIEEIKGTKKFMPIKYNSYRYRIGNAILNPAASFNMQTSIGLNAIVKKVSRPEGKIHIDMLREMIIHDIKKG